MIEEQIQGKWFWVQRESLWSKGNRKTVDKNYPKPAKEIVLYKIAIMQSQTSIALETSIENPVSSISISQLTSKFQWRSIRTLNQSVTSGLYLVPHAISHTGNRQWNNFCVLLPFDRLVQTEKKPEPK